MSSNKIPIISTTKLEKVKNCNASNAKPEPRVNSGTLTRWGILNDAIGDWLNNDAPEETAVKKAENEHFVNVPELTRGSGFELEALQFLTFSSLVVDMIGILFPSIL